MFQTLPGEIIRHGDVKVILNEGMPQHKNPFDKGRLILNFKVQFPPNNFLKAKSDIEKLKSLLPPPEELIIPDDCEEILLEELDPQAERYKRRYSDGTDGPFHHGHGRTVNCQTQ
jgi:DnaJ family protein A protein 1